MNDLKSFIKRNLFNSRGYLNAMKTREHWYKVNNFLDCYNEIMKSTSFLDKNSSFNERVFCILNDVTELRKCKYCIEKVKYRGLKLGYRKLCEKKECFKKEIRIEESNGLTKAMNRVLKGNQSKFKNIDENGLNSYQRCALKASKTFNIIQKSGLTRAQEIGKKANKTALENIDENGLNSRQRAGIKISITKHNDIDENGLNSFQRSTEKRIKTMRNDIVNGLDAFQRNFLKGAGKNSRLKYFNTDLLFQGKFEEDFLEKMKQFSLLDIVENSPRIQYKNVIRSSWTPDFKVFNFIFEIKSDWTYDGKGKYLNDRIINNKKWKAVLEQGYHFIVVWNKEYLMELESEDIKNLEDSLYLEHKFVDFNKENLKKLISSSVVLQEV